MLKGMAGMEKNFSGKTLEEAIEKASIALELDKGDFTYEIIEYPNKGFLGIGAKAAVICVSIEDEIKEQPQVQKKVEKQKEKRSVEEKKEFNKDNEVILLIENYMRSLLEKMGIAEYNLKVKQVDEKSISISLNGDNLADMTKKQGEIIDSIQLITALMLNKKTDKYYKLVVDINDFKKKSTDRLESLADRMAKQVLKTHRKITLNPMGAYQRRIIHAKLQGVENIHTYSVGEEPHRRVVIAFQNKGKKN